MSEQGGKTQGPSWWSAHDLSWDKVKARFLEEWRRFEKDTDELDKVAQEQALKFGHGARAAYDKFNEWSADFEKKLEADWKAMGATQKFAKVRNAIKHGWEQTVKDLHEK